ncbi:uncharacterized protein KGF55_002274 [Candida pseudojiufengensis]|uniref:uncharacterized protein n=1 Tax=Candida pseudojiufengensis TaxID=497109 RepID=UPI002224B871|nr:uncharacterized protein KGF55_002274 [Candida pseudojiufengensis]KAI5964332.1 hypothetical protein KGF55_002274 [Candida pseudojiufengensis]
MLSFIFKAEKLLYKKIIKELSDQSSKKFDNNTKTLEQLDHWRDNELRDIVKKRYDFERGEAYLTKDEVVNLMDWKLSKGKFRPTLPKLIRSNSEEEVKQCTQEGFKIMTNYFKSLPEKSFWSNATSKYWDEYLTVIKTSMKKLCKLRGIGPATASLLLSCLYKIDEVRTPPFFSDEAFMYYVIDPSRPNTNIKYSVKEYVEEFLPVLFQIVKTEKGTTNFNDLEKGGWALKYYSLHYDDILVSVRNIFDPEIKGWDKFAMESRPTLKQDDEQQESKSRKRRKTK